QRREALDQAALDARPLHCFDRARNDVERPRAVDVLTLRVDRERDAHLDDRAVGIGLPLRELADTERRQIVGELGGRRPSLARRREELVVEPAWFVLVPVDAHCFRVTIRATKIEIDLAKRCARASPGTKAVPAELPRNPRHACAPALQNAAGTVAVRHAMARL